ncbi:ABC transporter substrate-binding protein [Pseudomonas syringae]|nr:ABC transporter substrate-binding protein [Pseudomonas syringae]MBD8791447.1 ABC transporter substrate-binding protein [Pseudomonas syringae]MBD8801419.1 ABC transporter substrate-binding protein [Pseudomonas syringae]MBD8810304.1 ABC transporter substrate-binding protein [Pseudomonas syringae]
MNFGVLLLAWLVCLPGLAAPYPRTVVDLAGREVLIKAAPQRIVLQDSNDLLLLALLEREQPLARVVGWNNALENSDPSLWRQVAARWPQARQIVPLQFTSSQVDIEAILRRRPDLIVARLQLRAAIESTVLYSVLKRLDIPLVYVDTEADPLVNVPRSVELLGLVLNQSVHADAFVQDYRQQLAHLLRRTRHLPPRRVFIEVRAGQAGNHECCHTQGQTAWGLMIQALGAENVGSRYLRSPSGSVALETLIRARPDVYLMTGTQRLRNGVAAIGFGHDVEQSSITRHMHRLMARRGFAAVAAGPGACIGGLHHQFYNSVFNVVGLHYLAQAIWPQDLADLDPQALYRQTLTRYTTLPAEAPFVFAARACFAN